MQEEDSKVEVAVAVKRSGRKLPSDVAAIILRSLQEKAANPEAFKAKKSHAYEKDPGYTTCKPFRSTSLSECIWI